MTKKYHTLMTIAIPAFFISIVLISVSIKYFASTKDEPVRQIKSEKVRPALERTANVNKVMFKKFDMPRYKGKISTSIVNDTTLLIEIKSDDFPDNDAELIRRKQRASEYYKKHLCRVPNFSNLIHLQKRFKEYNIVISAEITQVDSQNVNLWQLTITPAECH